jgi:hypothetical protein
MDVALVVELLQFVTPCVVALLLWRRVLVWGWKHNAAEEQCERYRVEVIRQANNVMLAVDIAEAAIQERDEARALLERSGIIEPKRGIVIGGGLPPTRSK